MGEVDVGSPKDVWNGTLNAVVGPGLVCTVTNYSQEYWGAKKCPALSEGSVHLK